ncbi:hypothetical protein L596_014572 [Steinernema carpocapsae]|uniref:Uncharacterized protein n=1 Tax=Steinernema carpocapsae TaxID=34508 RepID=A0A4V6A2T2_STECR|nr:hypothetical protein L596_014572 [Steinernema carpocapsae]
MRRTGCFHSALTSFGNCLTKSELGVNFGALDSGNVRTRVFSKRNGWSPLASDPMHRRTDPRLRGGSLKVPESTSRDPNDVLRRPHQRLYPFSSAPFPRSLCNSFPHPAPAPTRTDLRHWTRSGHLRLCDLPRRMDRRRHAPP